MFEFIYNIIRKSRINNPITNYSLFNYNNEKFVIRITEDGSLNIFALHLVIDIEDTINKYETLHNAQWIGKSHRYYEHIKQVVKNHLDNEVV